jgi:signal transduction histidine kinase
VDAIVTQAGQLGRLIDDLLLASQIEADHLDLHLVATDVVTEARQAVEEMRAVRSTLCLEAPHGPLTVLADAYRLRQVFANLVTNAIKYSPEGSDVVLRLTRSEAEVHVAIIDHGVGIPDGAIPMLFDRFYRAEGAARQARGVGLGLYITRRIVEAHSGRITVASEPGRGSTFTVTLPVHDV